MRQIGCLETSVTTYLVTQCDIAERCQQLNRWESLKVPIHVRIWLASPAGLGFQWVKPVRVWSVTSRIWPILAWLVRAFGGDRLAAGLLLARTFMGGPKPESRIHTTTNTDSASLSLKGGTMSVTMSKTFTSPDFLTKFLEEYREISNKIQ